MTQPPHDEPTAAGPDELRAQVEQTRHELGRTVEALAARTDVRARAQEKATQIKDQAAAKADEMKHHASARAGEVRDQASAKAAEVKHHASARAGEVRDQASAKAAEVKHQASARAAGAGRLWEEKAPEPVRARASQGARLARDNRLLLLAAAAFGTAAWLGCRHRSD